MITSVEWQTSRPQRKYPKSELRERWSTKPFACTCRWPLTLKFRFLAFGALSPNIVEMKEEVMHFEALSSFFFQTDQHVKIELQKKNSSIVSCGQWSWYGVTVYLTLCQPDGKQHRLTPRVQFTSVEYLLWRLSRVYLYFVGNLACLNISVHVKAAAENHSIPFQTNINMRKFLGLWNVVFGSARFSAGPKSCLIYQYRLTWTAMQSDFSMKYRQNSMGRRGGAQVLIWIQEFF